MPALRAQGRGAGPPAVTLAVATDDATPSSRALPRRRPGPALPCVALARRVRFAWLCLHAATSLNLGRHTRRGAFPLRNAQQRAAQQRTHSLHTAPACRSADAPVCSAAPQHARVRIFSCLERRRAAAARQQQPDVQGVTDSWIALSTDLVLLVFRVILVILSCSNYTMYDDALRCIPRDYYPIARQFQEPPLRPTSGPTGPDGPNLAPPFPSPHSAPAACVRGLDRPRMGSL